MQDERQLAILQTNLQRIRERIEGACARVGRSPAEVTLVAVTKTIPIEVVTILPKLDLIDLGENRPQELWRKAPVLPNVRWHLIGHLQRNKIERTLPLVQLVHSVDSERLLMAIEEWAREQNRIVDVLLEINTTGEVNKHGFPPERILPLAPLLGSLRAVRIRGLMTMAAFTEVIEDTRPNFSLLRTLRDQLRPELSSPLDHLSMGMSNDFEIAVEEGATLVRIGTALFAGIKKG